MLKKGARKLTYDLSRRKITIKSRNIRAYIPAHTMNHDLSQKFARILPCVMLPSPIYKDDVKYNIPQRNLFTLLQKKKKKKKSQVESNLNEYSIHTRRRDHRCEPEREHGCRTADTASGDGAVYIYIYTI